MPEILIVADDLTGALDSAVGFAGRGHRVCVLRDLARIGEGMADAPGILAVTTASRELSEAEAVARIEALASALPLDRIPMIIKKVDSRLKGHVRAEVAALARAAGRRRTIAIPAIPPMGRIQRDGWLSGTAIAEPIGIRDRLHADAEVPDAQDEAAIDRAIAGGDGDTLWVGARSLAFALARHRFGPEPTAIPALPAPILCAIGSRDPVTLAQIDALDRPAIPAPDGAVPGIDAAATVEVIAMIDGGSDRTPAAAASAFAEGIAARLDRLRPMTLLASGGETAEAILDRLGIDCLDVIAEIAPGLPVSLADAPWGRMRVVTKSGGFGAPDLLQRIANLAGEPGREGDGP